MNKFFVNEDIMKNLSIDEAEKLIEYYREYKKYINNMIDTIDKITNIKKETQLNIKIEKELMIKILPIMNVYRTLLTEKYIDIHEQD